MILYHNDWGKQKAIPHIETPNESFRRMHFVLKDMGLKNNAFFLALHQPELIGVDPHDPSLDADTLARVAIECKINPWYYLREVVRLPASGVDSIPFRLNRAALFLFWSFFNSCHSFLIQPRQTGKTITSMALICLLMYFIYKNVRIKLFTHSNILVRENVDRLKMIRDGLPPNLISLNKLTDTENKEEVKYTALNNVYATKTAQQSVVGAFNAGRGGTVLVNQLDEAPFCANIDISYPVLMNAKNAAMAIAREAKIPFGDMITTTAAKLDTTSGAYVYNIMRKCCAFTESFYDFESNAMLKYVLRTNSQNDMMYGEFSFRQLGFTVEWAEQTARENNLSPEDIERDLYNRWSAGAEKPAVDGDLLPKLDQSKCTPVYLEEIEGYIFRWYEHPDEITKDTNRYFALGFDTSENIDEDFTTLHLLDISDLSTIMTSRCNDKDLIKLGEHIAEMLISNSNITLVPERKSTASVLISIICARLWNVKINPFTRIYNKVFQHRNDPPFSKMDVNNQFATEGPMKKFLGYVTAGSGENSRDNLYKLTLNRALNINNGVLKDINLIQELKTLTTKNGRVDHLAGKHDDSVISFLLAAWFVIHGRNHQLYNIPVYLKLSKISADGGTVDVRKSQRQRFLQSRILELENQIKHTQDSIVRMGLLREKSFLKTELNGLGAEVQSMSTIGDAQQTKQVGMTVEETLSAINYFKPLNKMDRLRKSLTDPYQSMW